MTQDVEPSPGGEDPPAGSAAPHGWERRTRRVPHGDVELAVVELGSATAPAVVVAHGIGSSARFIEAAFTGPFVTAGWRLVTFDLRGHGGSGAAPRVADHHLDVHAGDLAAVVDATGGEVAVVGGVSLGGHAAVRAVVGGSVVAEAVLACLPAWTGVATRGSGPHAVLAAEAARDGIGSVVARLEVEPALPTWLRSTLLTDYRRHDPASLVAALTALDGAEAPDADELTALPVPLALVAWPDDPGHPWEVASAWAASARRSALTTIDLWDLEDGLFRLGEAAVASLHRLGVRARNRSGGASSAPHRRPEPREHR